MLPIARNLAREVPMLEYSKDAEVRMRRISVFALDMPAMHSHAKLRNWSIVIPFAAPRKAWDPWLVTWGRRGRPFQTLVD